MQSAGLPTVDISRGLDAALAVKSKSELVRPHSPVSGFVCMDADLFLPFAMCIVDPVPWKAITVVDRAVDLTASLPTLVYHLLFSMQSNIQTASKLTSRLYRKVLVANVESILESDKKVKQSSLTEKMEKAMESLEKYGIKVGDRVR